MKRVTLWVALALGCGTCFSAGAQTPTPTPSPSPAPTPALSITGNTTIAENSLVKLTLSGAPVTSVAWLVMPDVSEYTSGQTLVFAAAPGTYTVIALAVSGTTPSILKTTVTVSADSTAQPKVIAIFDPSTLTTLPDGQAAIYQSTTIAQKLQASGITWLQYSTSDVIPAKGGSVPILQSTWGTKAAAVGFPALVTSRQGVVTAAPLPQTEAAVLQVAFNLRNK